MQPPGLELVIDDRRIRLPPGRPFVLGRGPKADLDVGHDRASRTHAIVELTAAGWTLTDHSRNGTWIGDRRISRFQLVAPVSVRLGDTPDAVTIEFRPVAEESGHDVLSEQGDRTTVRHVSTDRLTVGRLSDNDVVLDDLLVSRRHAELNRDETGWRIADLGSDNGTFVNGVRVRHAAITPRDVIGIGHTLLQLHGDRLRAAVDGGDVTFEVRDISVSTAKGKRLLCDVRFALPGRSMLAVVGPSGAGKSTLLRALTGARPADVGDIRYAGRDLYGEYDELRHRIGLVPQDDVLHPQLTVRRALRFAASLRFPADVSATDRERRIDEVLIELGLTAQAEQRIDTLSGGQRKRTSVALELLTKPSLLFLDEPTSGLDPGLDKAVMRTLRGLADGSDARTGERCDGRTVVVVTHSVANLDRCDRLLVLAPGGYVAFFGPPGDALAYFRTPDFAEMFTLLDRVPGHVLAKRFRESPLHHRFVTDPSAGSPSVAQRPAPAAATRQQTVGTQLAVLCRRYLAVIAADRQYAIFLVVLALLARVVPGSSGLSISAAVVAQESQPGQLLLLLVIGGALMGMAASIRELVKERPVYVRERAIGLSLGAYLGSKLLVLGAITGMQALLFTLLALGGHSPPDGPVLLGSGSLEVVVAIVAVTVVSMVGGLVISGFIDNADRGMPLLVLVLMLQLVASGGLFPVAGRPVLEQLAWFVPARWSFAMGASTVDLNATARGGSDALWAHAPGPWLLAAAMLGTLTVVLVVGTAALLRRLDPVRRPDVGIG